MSEENVIPLIVKSDCSPSFELWFIVKQSAQHSTYRVPESGSKIVQNDFGTMLRNLFVAASKFRSNFNIAQFELSGRAVRQMYDEQTICSSLLRNLFDRLKNEI